MLANEGDEVLLLDAEGQAGNRKYAYASLASVLSAIRGPLTSNGLSIM